ncbi:SDR family NAD(P)-dependent oxidoreductase [Desulforhopalus singaporensis]|uniref:NADP-dependent 3-hydroxy acid dehydrogenase YdfG n=1 Tax=Desulforhopalus singaporensis TaxID=91360 RepID=A0A1H0V7B1_9BACT|nr:SDR family NAD(P)-dependent oxidoreductase [Desulforhopalus singaporensis]SDP74287.1 NADP-dependent 3-hydroxy acid dehydrogenase YdfG [Desulforhopalus singaporensis]
MERKTVWISGAANGIGKATAILFKKHGYFVGIADIDEAGLKELQQELGAENSHYMVCDVSSPESVKAAFDSFALKTDKRLDVLVANAGVLAVSYFEETPLEKYKQIVDINAFGNVNQVYQALPVLKNTPGSHIVFISSSSAIWGIPFYTVYSATKGFVKHLTEALQIEFERHGITVNSVLPHMVKTAMEDAQLDGGAKPEQFMITPEITAEVIWKAANNPKKLHWVMGKNMGLFFFLKRIYSNNGMQKLIRKILYDPFRS